MQTVQISCSCARLHGWPLHQSSLDDVKAWLVDTAHAFNRAEIVMDRWEAIGLAQELRRLGRKVTEHQGASSAAPRVSSRS